MFFGRKNRKIKELQEKVDSLKTLSTEYMDRCRFAWKEVDLHKAINKDLKDQVAKYSRKINVLKAEVSRLSKAKNQLVKDKKTCQKTIKNMSKENKYYRDSKGRFAKRK